MQEKSNRAKRPYTARGRPLPYLRQWRLYRNLSQPELGHNAARMNAKGVLVPISPVTIMRLETRGTVANWDTIDRLARALGTDRRTLISEPPATE